MAYGVVQKNPTWAEQTAEKERQERVRIEANERVRADQYRRREAKARTQSAWAEKRNQLRDAVQQRQSALSDASGRKASAEASGDTAAVVQAEIEMVAHERLVTEAQRALDHHVSQQPNFGPT